MYYLAVAENSATAKSSILVWNNISTGWDVQQELPTKYATRAKAFKRDNAQWLAVALEKTEASGAFSTDAGKVVLYSWSNGLFSQSATIDSVKGPSDVEYFKINGAEYLAVCAYAGADGVHIYKWGSSGVQHFQSLDAGSDSRGAEHVAVGDKDYLVVVRFKANTKSKVYLWDAVKGFEKKQDFDTSGARRVKSFAIGSDMYSVVINNEDEPSKTYGLSNVYRWDKGNGAKPLDFLHELRTYKAWDAEHFEVEGHHYLAVANDGGASAASEVFLWDGGKFVLCQSLAASAASQAMAAVPTGAGTLLGLAGSSGGLTLFDAAQAREAYTTKDYKSWDSEAVDVEGVRIDFNDFVITASSNGLELRGWPGADVKGGAFPSGLSNVADIEVFEHDGLAYVAVGSTGDLTILRAKSATVREFEVNQTIAGSWGGAVKSFADGPDTMLVAGAGCAEAHSKVYELTKGGVKFEEATTFEAHCPTDFDTFVIDGVTHLAVANSKDGASSEVFKWEGGSISSVQKLPNLPFTSRVKAFSIDADLFLAFTVSRGSSSTYTGSGVIYKWSGSEFTKLQQFPVSGGCDVQHFGRFLVAGNAYRDDRADASKSLPAKAVLFRWDGGRFVEHATLDTTDAAVAVRPLALSGEIFLASANAHSKKVILHQVVEPAVFQHFRFRPERVENSASKTPELSEIAFFHGGHEVSRFGAAASSPGGTFDSGKGPSKAIDGSEDTQWSPKEALVPLVVSFASPVLVDAFKFRLGEDPSAAPTRWALEGWDGLGWVTLHTVLQASDLPAIKKEWTPLYPLQVQREHLARVVVNYEGRRNTRHRVDLRDSAGNIAVRWVYRSDNNETWMAANINGAWEGVPAIDDAVWAAAPSEHPAVEIAISAEVFKVSLGGVWRRDFVFRRTFGWPVWQVEIDNFESPKVSTVRRSELAWRPVFRQTSSERFKAGEWSKNPTEPLRDAFASLDSLDRLRVGGDLTFRMSWPGEGFHEQVWSQVSNPVLVDSSAYSATHTGIWGYAPLLVPYPGSDFAGLQKSEGSKALLDGTSKDGVAGTAFAIGLTGSDPKILGPCEVQADLKSDCKPATKFALDVAVELMGWELAGVGQEGALLRQTALRTTWGPSAMLRGVTGVVFRLLQVDTEVHVGLTADQGDDHEFKQGCFIKFKSDAKADGGSGEVTYATGDTFAVFLKDGVSILRGATAVGSCPSVGAGAPGLIFKLFAKKYFAGIEVLDVWYEKQACGATFSEWTGATTVSTEQVSGSTQAALDAECCKKCDDSADCVFWQREQKAVGSQMQCRLMASPTGETTSTKWRGGIKLPRPSWVTGTLSTKTTSTTVASTTRSPTAGTPSPGPAVTTTLSPGESRDQAAQSAICRDRPGFSDERGLDCGEWRGMDCSAAGAQGYSEKGVNKLLASCPASCGLCGALPPAPTPAPPPAIVIEERETVRAALRVGVDLTALTEAQRTEALRASVAAALGVSTSSVLNIEVVEAARRLLDAAGRQLAAPTFELRYEVAVPPSMTARSIVLQATTLASADTASSSTFSATLRGAGVDTSAMTVEVTERPAVAQVQVFVSGSGEVLSAATGGGGASAPAPAAGAIVLSTCADQSGYVDEQGEECDGWVGYNCSDDAWLRTERPYTAAGLREVQERCPLACGLCSPAGRRGVAELLAECADDGLLATFCSRWRGLNCSQAAELGFGRGYTDTLLQRCPQTCGVCAPSTPQVCDDSPTYVDPLGFACSSWAGYSCTKSYAGYTRAGVLAVQAACPRSCGFCPGAAAAPQGERLLSSAGAGCRDDPDFRFAGQFSCGNFIGRFCTYGTLYLEPRWLMGPRGISEWHEKLWGSCALACGRCSPAERLEPSDLLLECEDDEHMEEWCAYNWAGTACSSWSQSLRLVLPGEAERFNATLFGRCPDTCGLCTKPSCGPGQRRNPAAHLCEACAAGRYAAARRSGRAAQRCADARRGFFVGSPGAAAEEPCQPGSFSATPGQAACELCPAGTFAAASGSSACVDCDPGWYQDSLGGTECTRCEVGRYSNATAASSCESCPETFTTELQAATEIDACLCPEGTHFDQGGGLCLRCPRGTACSGGHPYGNDSLDLSPVLLPGMMSLAEDPFSVYSCVGGDISCPGERAVPLTEEAAEEVCADGRSGPRCHICPHAHWRHGYYCKPCGAHGFWANNYKILFAFVVQLWLTQKAYLQQGQVTTAAKLMFFAVLSFCQVLYSLSKVPLKWPKLMRDFFVLLEPFGWQSVLSFLEFKHDCTLGISLQSLVIRDVCMPILPFLNFAILGLIAKFIFRKPLHWPYVANVIACFYMGLFINVSSLALSMFPSEEMPNGKFFVRHHPGVDFDSEERMTAVPISLTAVAIYCGLFLAYTAMGVRYAPRAANNAAFMQQFDFLVSDVNPNCYWWSLVDLAYSFALAVVQALSANIYVQIYLSMLVLLAIMLVEVHVAPSVHPLVNVVNCSIKIALFLILAFSTAFIDVEVIDMAPHRRPFGLLLLALFPIMGSVTLCCVLMALYKRYVTAQPMIALRTACMSRSAMFHIACLPEKELVDCAATISDSEAAVMRECSNMVSAVYFNSEASDSFWSQRIIASSGPFRIMDKHTASRLTMKAIADGQLQHVLEENARLRSKKRLLLGHAGRRSRLREHADVGEVTRFILSKGTLKDKWTGFLSHTLPAFFTKNSASGDLARGIGSRSSSMGVVSSAMTRIMGSRSEQFMATVETLATRHGVLFINEEEFVDEFREAASHIKEDDLRAIFKAVDTSDSGTARVCDIVTVLRMSCYEEIATSSFPFHMPGLGGGEGEMNDSMGMTVSMSMSMTESMTMSQSLGGVFEERLSATVPDDVGDPALHVYPLPRLASRTADHFVEAPSDGGCLLVHGRGQREVKVVQV